LLDPAVAWRISRTLVAEVIYLGRGAPVEPACDGPGCFGLLVLDEVLARHVRLGHRSSIELFQQVRDLPRGAKVRLKTVD